jgi:hypothetical protein
MIRGAISCHEGFWTLEIPDHPIGRAISTGMQRSAVVAEAHHNVLRLSVAAVRRNGLITTEQQFLVKAGAGGFICHMQIGKDRSLDDLSVHVRARTWLLEEMLRSDQTLLVGEGMPGDRLGEDYLLPAPLRVGKYVVKREGKP